MLLRGRFAFFRVIRVRSLVPLLPESTLSFCFLEQIPAWLAALRQTDGSLLCPSFGQVNKQARVPLRGLP